MPFARARSNGTYALGARTPCARATFDRIASARALECAEQARVDDIARASVPVAVAPPSHRGGGDGGGDGAGVARDELVVARTPGGREDEDEDEDEDERLDEDGTRA